MNRIELNLEVVTREFNFTWNNLNAGYKCNLSFSHLTGRVMWAIDITLVSIVVRCPQCCPLVSTSYIVIVYFSSKIVSSKPLKVLLWNLDHQQNIFYQVCTGVKIQFFACGSKSITDAGKPTDFSFSASKALQNFLMSVLRHLHNAVVAP